MKLFKLQNSLPFDWCEFWLFIIESYVSDVFKNIIESIVWLVWVWIRSVQMCWSPMFEVTWSARSIAVDDDNKMLVIGDIRYFSTVLEVELQVCWEFLALSLNGMISIKKNTSV
jgi:hypothetical protein